MRIAIDYTSALAQSAGIGRYTRGLTAALARVDTTDELVLYSSEAPARGQVPPAAANVRLRLAGIGGRAVGNRGMTILWHRLCVPLPIELLVGRADVFHAPDFSLAPTLWARRVVTIHDLAYLTHPACALPRLIAYLEHVVPRAVRVADEIIAVSQRTAADLIERLGVAPEKVTVIHLGVDPGFRPVRDVQRLAELERRYGLRHPLILAVGTLEPRKNYERLIAAFARATRAPDGPRMLAIAGREGWLYEQVYAAVVQHGVADRVRFLGYVPEADLPALYSSAEVLAMPSLYEGFGIPVIEAMACGTPVLCSDGGSLPEVADDAALVVPATDGERMSEGLLRLVSDTSLRARLSACGVERARHFSWEDAARATIRVYARAAARPRGKEDGR
ncbi:MAG: glycosyltransferase family 4 protein [Ktedonobacterales bacterium]|nr:glycosyltransferase family 4 protein [Ktedonobacterales bacterium]